jgi:hypothetical protein
MFGRTPIGARGATDAFGVDMWRSGAGPKRARQAAWVIAMSKSSKCKRPETPLGRLDTDGATSSKHTRRRIQWLAHEWKLPPADVAKVMKCTSYEIGAFAKKYRVSYDWLLNGDLKGLQRMTRERSARSGKTLTNAMNADEA